MATFKFSLEQVLRYRQQLEERAMQELAKAQAARDARLRQAEEYAASMEAERVVLSNPAALTEQERWLHTGYLEGLRLDLDKARQDLIVLEEELDRCRADLIQRAQDRKLLEKLKTKQAARHAAEETQREQRNYDEIATLRFVAPAI